MRAKKYYKQSEKTIAKLSKNLFVRSTSLKIRKMQIKTTQRYHFLSMTLAKSRNYENILFARQKKNTIHCK